MPERPVLEDGLTPPATTVAAAPVDTFVRTNAGAQLDQLAQGLSSIAPEIGKLYRVEQDKANSADTDEGANAAREAQASGLTTWNDAIKSGKVKANASPFYRAAAQEQFGRVAADSMAADFRVYAAEDPILSGVSTDNQDLTNSWNSFRKDWTEKHVGSDMGDRYFQDAFGHAADVHYADALHQFSVLAASRLEKQYGDGHFQEVFSAAQNILAQDSSPAGHQKFIDAMNQLLKVGITANPKAGRVLNEMTVKAVAAYALQTHDTSVLDDLQKVMGGSGSLATTQYGAALIHETQQNVAKEVHEGYARAEQKEGNDRREAIRATLSEANKRLGDASDPHNVDLSDLKIRLRGAGYGDAAEGLVKLQEAYTHGEYTDDPKVAASLFRRIHFTSDGESSTTTEEVASALSAGSLSIPTYRALNDDLEKGGNGAKYTKDALLNQVRSETRGMFISEFGFENPQMRQRASNAVDDVTFRYIKWKEGPGAGASEVEQRNFLKQAKDEVFNRYSEHGAISDKTKVPASPATVGAAGPAPVDYTKAPVTDASNIGALEREVSEVELKKRNALSPASLLVLQSAGINPSSKTFLQDIKKFIAAQRQFHPAPAQDSTSN